MRSPHDIPPLAAVRVFEAVARHLSFTRAAEELGMTQAAASYQIKVLEERVGQPLFLRKARSIELTEAGRVLSPALTDAFQRMSAAFDTMQDRTSQILSIKSQATFAAQWLMQRIGLFQSANPDLAVRLDATMNASDFQSEDIDVVIRAGSGQWPGLVSHLLVESVFTPMLSPRLLAEMGGLSGPADLLRYRLFDATDPWWSIWFEKAGVTSVARALPPTSCFGTQFLEGRAVLVGKSVGILNPHLFQSEIASGQLVQPFDILGRGDIAGYFLVYPEARRNVPKIRLFRDWILGEIEASAHAPLSFAS